MNHSVKTILAVFVALALILSGAVAALLLTRPHSGGETRTTGNASGTSDEAALRAALARLPVADTGSGDLSQEERLQQLKNADRLSEPKYKTVVSLSVADAPGKPKSIEPAAAARTTQVSVNLKNLDFSANDRPAMLRTSAGASPSPTPPVSYATITFQTPARGAQLTVGQSFTLSWTINNPISLTYKVLLSNDGGTTFQLLRDNLYFYHDSTSAPRTVTLTLPNKPGFNCRFRVEGYVGSVLYAFANSQPFTLLAPATPTPSPTPKPSPSAKPTPTASPAPSPTAAPAVTPRPTPTLVPLPLSEPRYVRSTSVFVDRTADPTRWLSLDIQAPTASRIVWQVSKTPFTGFSDADSLSPAGLLASGSLNPSLKEFAIDFGSIVSQVEQKPMAIPNEQVNDGAPFSLAARAILLNQDAYSLHVRAIALDPAGRVIGDPGIGCDVSFGIPQIDIGDVYIPGSITGKIEVWIADNPLQNAGTFSYKPVDGVVAHPKDKEWYLQFRNPPAGTVDMALQVTTLPFAKGVIESPAGLVREVDYVRGYYPATPLTTPVPLAAFVPTADEIGSKTIRYYVRAVFYRQSETDPSVLVPSVSEAQTIYYNGLELMGSAGIMQTFQPTEVFTVKSYVPATTFLRYIPIQWEAQDWKEWFEVTRQIKAEEMCFKFTRNGETIYPYTYYQLLQSPDALSFLPADLGKQAMTLDQYQAKLNAMLPVGTIFHLTINDSSSIWSEAWNLAKSIYTSVQQAYESIKSTIINTVVNFLPVSEKAKSVLRAALNTALNAGLAALGIPPTLPNFAALASEGLDYCLEQAILEECGLQGVLPEEITDEARSRLKSEIRVQLEAMEAKSRTNPLNVDFLKPASNRIYRPAYIDVSISNYSSHVSPSGTLSVSYGLDGSAFSFFKPVKAFVPPLQPGKSTVIRAYLKEKIPFDYSLTPFEEYYAAYYGKTGHTGEFRVSVKYDVPDVLAAAE